MRELQEITRNIRSELLQRIDRPTLEAALTVLQEISQTVETTLAGKDR